MVIKLCSLKESSWMSFYKGLAYFVYLKPLRVLHINNSEVCKALFGHRLSGAGLDERKKIAQSSIGIGVMSTLWFHRMDSMF